MRRILAVMIGLALCVAVSPVEAKHKNKIKTVVGCVQGTPSHYALSAVTKKGKHHDYALVGDRDFGAEVGHKIQAQGVVNGGSMKVSSMKDLSASCR
jgi:hypothetical protein